LKNYCDTLAPEYWHNFRAVRVEKVCQSSFFDFHRKLASFHKDYEAKFNIYKQLIETTNQTIKEKYILFISALKYPNDRLFRGHPLVDGFCGVII
jgi:hypothetical protein